MLVGFCYRRIIRGYIMIAMFDCRFCRSYLLRISTNIVERPQHMWMRVACGIHLGDIESALNTYELMSLKYFTHATPTLFNAGTPFPQMSSCTSVQFLGYVLRVQFNTLHGSYPHAVVACSVFVPPKTIESPLEKSMVAPNMMQVSSCQ